jgi:TPR repeat protein
LVKAVEWHRKAADQGNPLAQYNLGLCYYNGEGIDKDLVEAVKWYRKAADQGDIDAQDNLGLCYYLGEGIDKDLVKAVKWWRKAADQGNPLAQYNLGVCYYKGEGIPKDLVEAVKWYRKAADQGNTSAQYNLGLCYCQGKGVPKDLVKAVEWHRKAADQGNPLAQNHLGFCYYNGEGVPKDLTEAMKWWRKSALDYILCTTDSAKELEDQGWVMGKRGYVFDILNQDKNLKSWLKKAVVVGGEIGVDGQIKFPVRLEMHLSSKAGIEPWEYEASAIFFLEEGKIKFHDIWLRAGTLGRTRCVYISAEAGMKELTWDLHRK